LIAFQAVSNGPQSHFEGSSKSLSHTSSPPHISVPREQPPAKSAPTIRPNTTPSNPCINALS
jgi:hypothetical protein